MKYVKNLMLAFPYFDRVPDQSIIVGKNGVRYDRLIATRGADYLMVYNYNGNEMNLNFDKISGATKNVWWMDAATGGLKYLGRFKSGVQHFASIPHTKKVNDGVLIAVDVDRNYLTKSQNIIDDNQFEGKKRDLNE